MWNKQSLRSIISDKLSDYKLVIASNRQPYSHILKNGKITCLKQPGGLVAALDPVMRAANGTWVAMATSEGDARTVDDHSRVRVPTQDGYTLRRIFLSKEEFQRYYFGYANQGLWPLCHVAYTRPFFHELEWQAYQNVNRKFAQTIADEIGDEKAFVWVQDFHLVLVAKYLKEMGVKNIITSIFWHIPWPNPEVFRICPHKNEIIEGMLAYDLTGFHIKYHADNFIDCVDRFVESRIDRERTAVSHKEHETLIRSYPISVDFEETMALSDSPKVASIISGLEEEFEIGKKKLIVGVDRIDYTKGIPDRLRAFEKLLEKYPEHRGQVLFFQMGQVSRAEISPYKKLNDEINELVENINWKYSEKGWVPIHFHRQFLTYEDIIALYRRSDVCVVSSLHDGMNLVAKEFVAARTDECGVLLLSQFTGAARELTDAVQVNPYDVDNFADCLHQALVMNAIEQQRRMQKMRSMVQSQNIYRWAGKIFSELLRFDFHE